MPCRVVALVCGLGSPVQRLRRPLRVVPTRAAPTDVFVLGLDDVLVDSAAERTRSATRAAATLYAERVPRSIVQDDAFMRSVTEMSQKNALTPAQIITWLGNLADKGQLTADALEGMQLENVDCAADVSVEELHQAFLKAQEEWMNEDLDDWLQHTESIGGMAEVLSECPYPFYVTTSQSAKAASLVLQKLLGQKIEADSPRLFATGEHRRVESIKEVNARPLCRETGARLHFVDSSLQALQYVQASSELSEWRLYCTSWSGQNPELLTKAQALGARVLSLSEFRELLVWGILMGVDDGCEPTPEEVQAGVAQE